MIETNKLLAEFLAIEITNVEDILYISTNGKFDLISGQIWNPMLDWNQLMQVINKINFICAEKDEWERFYQIKDEIPHISKTYYSCVDFVNWYNEIKNL